MHEWSGHCPICRTETVFRAAKDWFRDFLFCVRCHSVPRERALFRIIEAEFSGWQRMSIHECSPVARGASVALARECSNYRPTQFFPDVPLGSSKGGVRCEDLERQTFPDAYFDLVITQDVMEHVFDPKAAYQEIWRTLKPGGAYVHTVPIYKGMDASVQVAMRDADGTIRHIMPPEWHHGADGTPSLVTWRYGYDLPNLIEEWTGFEVECRRYTDRHRGLLGEFSDVLICRKSNGPKAT